MNDDEKIATRGPSYNWEDEARSYKLECDNLQTLLSKSNTRSEHLFNENEVLKQALKDILDFHFYGDHSEPYRTILKNFKEF